MELHAKTKKKRASQKEPTIIIKAGDRVLTQKEAEDYACLLLCQNPEMTWRWLVETGAAPKEAFRG